MLSTERQADIHTLLPTSPAGHRHDPVPKLQAVAEANKICIGVTANLAYKTENRGFCLLTVASGAACSPHTNVLTMCSSKTPLSLPLHHLYLPTDIFLGEETNSDQVTIRQL